MSTLQLQITDEEQRILQVLADRDGQPVDRAVLEAALQKARAIDDVIRLRKDVADADPAAVSRYLDAAHDHPPAEGDRMPDTAK